MNPGGEPGRDDSGLPPVDIEIPDDARELDRDVQAYYREIRAERRAQRGLRLRGSLAKDGIILPLLACCLILALITGTLLTVFTATSNQNNLAGFPSAPGPTATHRASHAASGGANSAAPRSSAPAPPATVPPTVNAVPGVLPPGETIVVGAQTLPLQALSRAALVLIPPHCNCTSTVEWLIYVAYGAHAWPYLVYTAGTRSDVLQLYASLSNSYRAEAYLAAETDNNNVLRESIPPNLPEDGLAVILIGPTKHVLYATGLRQQDDATTVIKALAH